MTFVPCYHDELRKTAKATLKLDRGYATEELADLGDMALTAGDDFIDGCGFGKSIRMPEA